MSERAGQEGQGDHQKPASRDDLSLIMAVAVTIERVHTKEIQHAVQRLSKGGRNVPGLENNLRTS